jgi:hypothetical protein
MHSLHNRMLLEHADAISLYTARSLKNTITRILTVSEEQLEIEHLLQALQENNFSFIEYLKNHAAESQ